MNWRLSILSLLVAFSLGVELPSFTGAAAGKDQPHALVMLDDDLTNVAGSKDDADASCPFVDFVFGWPAMAWTSDTGVADMTLSLKKAVSRVPCQGVRRHRWLCVERC